MRFGVRIFSAALLATSLLPAPALAQASATVGPPKKEKTGLALEAEQRRARQKEIDKEYDAMRRSTDVDTKPVKVDPWANMRSPNENQQQKR